ncbi:hypothetical protein ACMAZF_20115 (plasmid) [Psychrobium sp. nBUS_13]|uniref:hypothetical protein n=1 Tax=Psychrobium sp. nBUS_13 TaxID=3395319 RepID=UPI003EB6ED03
MHPIKKILTTSVLFTLGMLSAPNAFSSSVTIAGKLDVKSPKVQISANGEIVAYTKEASIDATQYNDICEITTDLDIAKQTSSDGTKYCYFEYLDTDGLEQNKFNLTGYVQSVGTYSVNYQLSYISGTTATQHIIYSTKKDFTAIEPVLPITDTTKLNIGDTWFSPQNYTIYNSKAGVKALEVIVEPRKYPQKVSLTPSNYCIVDSGDNNCVIVIDKDGLTLGDKDLEVERIGFTSFHYKVNSVNDYFSPYVSDSVTVDWDYTPPTAQDAQLYVRSDGAGEIDVQGVSLKILNGTAKVVVTTPHNNLSGDWWIPDDVNLTFYPSNERELLPHLEFQGNTLFTSPEVTESNTIEVSSFGTPQLVGDAFVYNVDLTDVPDGGYTMKVDVEDDYNNSSSLTIDEENVILRQKPLVKIFRNFTEIQDGDAFYFTSELVFSGFNGFKDDVTITAIYVNDQELPIKGTQDVKLIDRSDFEFKNKEEYTFKVVAKDKLGNISEQENTLVFAPIEFTSNMKDYDRATFEAIESVSIDIYQTEGEICRFYANELLAVRNARPGRLGCYFVWDELPDSFTSKTSRRGIVAIGTVNASNTNATYHVEVFNVNGDSFSTQKNTISLTTQKPKAPAITVTSKEDQIGDIYPVSIKGGEAFRASSESSPGRIALSFNDDTGETSVTERSPIRLTSPLFYVNGKYVSSANDNKNLWDIQNVKIESKYVKLPTLRSEKTVKVISVPDDNISVSLDFKDDQILTTDKVKAYVSLGEYSRKSGYYYDKDTMGDWDITVGYYDRKLGIEPLLSPIQIDANGQAVFDMPMDTIDGKSGVMVAKATLRSPYPEYKKEILSSKAYFVVYKGSEIKGSINSGRIIDRVPLRTSLSYSPSSKEDLKAMGDVQWLVSEDGINYTVDTEFTDTLRRKKIYSLEGIYYVKVKVTNKFSQVETFSEPVKIIAFSRPELKLVQEGSAFIDEPATFKLLDNGDDASLTNGHIQWSFDNKNTWIDGSSVESFMENEINGRYLYARMKYNSVASDEDVGEYGFAEQKIRYFFTKRAQIYASIDSPLQIEIGKDLTLKGSAVSRINGFTERIQSEWLLPDGSVVSGNELTVTAKEDDAVRNVLLFTYRTWIDGLKEQTTTETVRKVKTWLYEFPETELVISKPIIYAPDSTQVRVVSGRHYAPGVTYSYELQASDRYELISQDGAKFTIKVNEPGVHLVTVKMDNGRGENVNVEQYIQALPPLPIAIEFVNAFSNEHMRYPLDLTTRSRVVLGHKKDRVQTYKWSLDGEVINDNGRYRELISGLGIGTHTVSLEVTSSFGQVGTSNFVVEVNPNTPPTATLSKIPSTPTLTSFKLNCRDTDGKIVAYSWNINGEDLTFGSSEISFNKSKLLLNNTITGKCWDDSYSSDAKTINFSNNE